MMSTNLAIKILTPGIFLVIVSCNDQQSEHISSSPTSMPQSEELAFTGKDINNSRTNSDAKTTTTITEKYQKQADINKKNEIPEWVGLYLRMLQKNNPLLKDQEFLKDMGVEFDANGRPKITKDHLAQLLSPTDNTWNDFLFEFQSKHFPKETAEEITNASDLGVTGSQLDPDLQEKLKGHSWLKLTNGNLVKIEIAGRSFDNVPLRPAANFFEEYQQYLLLSDGDLEYRKNLAFEFGSAVGTWVGRTARPPADWNQPKVAIHQLETLQSIMGYKFDEHFLGVSHHSGKDITRSRFLDLAALTFWTNKDSTNSQEVDPQRFWARGNTNGHISDSMKVLTPRPLPELTHGNGRVLVDLTPTVGTAMGELLKTLFDRMGYMPTAIVEHNGKMLVVFEAQLTDMVGSGSYTSKDDTGKPMNHIIPKKRYPVSQ